MSDPDLKCAVRRACVLVVGDFGRSPRMQYHTLSLLKHSVAVDVVAMRGSAPPQELVSHAGVRLHLYRSPPTFAFLPGVLRLAAKAVWQTCVLLWTLFLSVGATDLLLVQNPPSVPTLPVAWLFARLLGACLMVDWHNYGHTVLACSLHRPSTHPAVRFYRWLEESFGRRADLHLCVTRAMRDDLQARLGIAPTVLYDRPAARFHPHPPDAESAHSIFLTLSKEHKVFRAREPAVEGGETTRFTRRGSDGAAQWREDRPKLVISCTSWTEDEDFGLLLDALQRYDGQSTQDLPDIVCVVTGKGPLKAHYEARMARMDLTHVQFATPWVSAEAYPGLVASACLGVCLHASTSGLDLPMKVVDMFGCAVPVLALDFPALPELVQPGSTGEVFQDSQELCSLLTRLLSQPSLLDSYRAALRQGFARPGQGWDDHWDRIVPPLLGAGGKV